MFDRNVSKILARCLDDVENGRLSVEECVRQYPRHAEEIRRQFALRDSLARLDRPDPSSRGELLARQKLLSALADQNTRGVPKKMIPNLLSSAIAKAIAGTLAGAILLTGAAGAAAAMGGPNVPGQALSALGLNGDQHNSDENTPTATATATKTVTAGADVEGNVSPNTNNFFGLCQAWTSGSGTGQANKDKAPAFKDLIDAAGATSLTGDDLNKKVADYCKTVAKPSADAGASPAASTATATPSDSHGNPNGTPGGNSNASGNTGTGNADHPTGKPAETPTPPPVSH